LFQADFTGAMLLLLASHDRRCQTWPYLEI